MSSLREGLFPTQLFVSLRRKQADVVRPQKK
jgi:hypothetical protein